MDIAQGTLRLLVEKWFAPTPAAPVRVTRFSPASSNPTRCVRVEALRAVDSIAIFWVYPDLPKGMWCRLGRVQGALLCRRETGSRLAEGHPKGMALTRAHVVPTLADGLSARLLGRQA